MIAATEDQNQCTKHVLVLAHIGFTDKPTHLCLFPHNQAPSFVFGITDRISTYYSSTD